MRLPSAPAARAILTRVAAHANDPVSESVIGARMLTGFAPRPLAYRVKCSCPWPTGIAITSGAMPGKITAGARNEPCEEATSTRSPSAMPILAAVCGLISTQLDHIADVSGSGSSCNHGRWAVDPSPNAGDAYGRKWNGYCDGSPSNRGSSNRRDATGGSCRPAGRFGKRSRLMADGPWLVAAALLASSSAVFQGSDTGDFSFPATSIKTSAVARVLWIG